MVAGVGAGRGVCRGFKGAGQMQGPRPGIKPIGVSAKSATGFCDSQGGHILSSALILIRYRIFLPLHLEEETSALKPAQATLPAAPPPPTHTLLCGRIFSGCGCLTSEMDGLGEPKGASEEGTRPTPQAGKQHLGTVR